MSVKKGQLIHIVWHDAETINEWTDADDKALTDHSSSLCETVGYVVTLPTKRNPSYVIASTRSKSDGKWEYNAITKIPKVWTDSVKELPNE